MTKLEAQQKFATMIPMLFDKAHEMGFAITLGDAYRDPRVSYGSETSLHKQRLALDINLFNGDKYLSSTEDHRPIGEWWESIGGSWGGRFNDGNHYSLAYGGMR
jgi:hypothetical protein